MKIILSGVMVILLAASFFVGHSVGTRQASETLLKESSIYEHIQVEGALIEGRIESIDHADVVAIKRIVSEHGDLLDEELYNFRLSVTSEDEVEVTTENFTGNESGESFRYLLSRENDLWTIIRSDSLYIIH